LTLPTASPIPGESPSVEAQPGPPLGSWPLPVALRRGQSHGPLSGAVAPCSRSRRRTASRRSRRGHRTAQPRRRRSNRGQPYASAPSLRLRGSSSTSPPCPALPPVAWRIFADDSRRYLDVSERAELPEFLGGTGVLEDELVNLKRVELTGLEAVNCHSDAMDPALQAAARGRPRPPREPLDGLTCWTWTEARPSP
jgi:hypothetical protein